MGGIRFARLGRLRRRHHSLARDPKPCRHVYAADKGLRISRRRVLSPQTPPLLPLMRGKNLQDFSALKSHLWYNGRRWAEYSPLTGENNDPSI